MDDLFTIKMVSDYLSYRILDLRLGLDCSQSPIFSWDRRCWSLSSTGSYLGLLMRAKLRRGEHGEGVTLQVALASRGQDGDPSNAAIDIYDLTKKNRELWTVLISPTFVKMGFNRTLSKYFPW